MLLEAKHLKKSYRNGRVRAVDDVSFFLRNNETLGIVGASGSGKSTLAKLILNVVSPEAGEITFQGSALGAVFQDPYLSLDPKMTVRDILEEPFRIRGEKNRDFLSQKVKALLSAVELSPRVQVFFSKNLNDRSVHRRAFSRHFFGGQVRVKHLGPQLFEHGGHRALP